MEKIFAFFRRSSIVKKISLSSERSPITLDEIIIKTVQHAKAEMWLFFWMDKVIDTSKYEPAWRERWTC